MTDIISVRELHHDFLNVTKAVQKGRHLTVARHGKPLFLITPLAEKEPNKRTHTFADLMKISFKSGDKNLSKKIDEIVYGI